MLERYLSVPALLFTLAFAAACGGEVDESLVDQTAAGISRPISQVAFCTRSGFDSALRAQDCACSRAISRAVAMCTGQGGFPNGAPCDCNVNTIVIDPSTGLGSSTAACTTTLTCEIDDGPPGPIEEN